MNVTTRDAESPTGVAEVYRPAYASAGLRVLAFTIDVLVVMIVVAASWLISRSAVLALVIAVELVAGLWVLQGRTGLSVGKALLRLRVTRDGEPYSPGVGPAFVRLSITALGGLVLGVGAWLVELSSGWDRSRKRRSWADAAAQTVVVTVPSKARRAQWSVGGTIDESTSLPAPSVIAQVRARPELRAPLAPVIRGGATPGLITAAPAPVSAPVSVITAAPLPVIDTGSVGTTGSPGGETRGAVPLEPAQTDADASGELLLVFDTGQRENLPIPVAVNLGRRPEETTPGDLTVTVRDPDGTVSKTHARLEHTRQGTWITDLGSTNGTELLDEDGHSRPLTPHTRVAVEDGVRIRVGDRVFTVNRLVGEGRS